VFGNLPQARPPKHRHAAVELPDRGAALTSLISASNASAMAGKTLAAWFEVSP
jgi:hypothetical protein